MRGLILGKFLPPHLGHDYLFQFARGCVDELVIVVATLAGEPIDGQLRHRWVSEMAPWARVVHLTDENPSYPHEHPDFWEIWTRSLRGLDPDLVFSSEDYGEELARRLGAEHVPVDPGRDRFAISGTQVRQDPYRHWELLPPCVKQHYALRVALVGPESTGKTTLARQLAEHYQTLWVPEYARAYLDWRNQRRPGQDLCHPEDIPRIAAGQRASEDALARQANRLLFCDTDLATTAIWSEHFFQTTFEPSGDYSLTLLCHPDVTWVEDPHRTAPHLRGEFLQRFEERYAPRRPRAIRGTYPERLALACGFVGELLSSRQKVAADVP